VVVKTDWAKAGNEYYRFEDRRCLEVKRNLDLEPNANQMRRTYTEFEMSPTSEIDDFFFVAIDYPISVEAFDLFASMKSLIFFSPLIAFMYYVLLHEFDFKLILNKKKNKI
jgi:hypothetical protein